MKSSNLIIIIVFIIACVGLGVYLYTEKINEVELLNKEITTLKSVNDSLLLKAIIYTDSIEAENTKIQVSKDSLLGKYNTIEKKLLKNKKQYESNINDTCNIYELYNKLSNIY
jgi:hypothetical protein